MASPLLQRETTASFPVFTFTRPQLFSPRQRCETWMPEKGPCTSVKSVESIVIEIYWRQKLQPTHIVEQPGWGFETFSSLPPEFSCRTFTRTMHSTPIVISGSSCHQFLFSFSLCEFVSIMPPPLTNLCPAVPQVTDVLNVKLWAAALISSSATCKNLSHYICMHRHI